MEKLYKYRSGCIESAVQMVDTFRKLLPANIICFDTETTGISPEENFITQISAVIVHVNCDGSTDMGEGKGWLIKPPIPVPRELEEKKIGPSNEQLKDAPTWETVFPEVKAFFEKSDIVLAQNTPFDISFMKKMYKTSGEDFPEKTELDTLVIARSLYLGAKNHKLETLLKELGLKTILNSFTKGKGRFHDSDVDVIGTVLLFQRELQDYDELMGKKRVLPYFDVCSQFDHIVNENGETVQVKHNATSTRFYTNFGELRYTHYPKEWAADFNLNVVDMLRWESEIRKYTGCDRISDIKKFDPKSKQKEDSPYDDENLLLA